MRMLKTFLMIVALQPVLVLVSPGQSPSPGATGSPAATATATPITEVEILQDQLKTSKEYNDRITGSFATLNQTAIGVFIFLFGAAFGISYVSVIKMRRSERKELLANIETRHTKMVADYQTKLEAANAKAQENYETFTSRVISAQDKSTNQAKQILMVMEHRITYMEADRLAKDGIYSDALIGYSACVALATKLDNPNLVQKDLVAMQTILSAWAPTPIADGVYHQIMHNFKDTPPQVANTLEVVVKKLKDRVIMP